MEEEETHFNEHGSPSLTDENSSFSPSYQFRIKCNELNESHRKMNASNICIKLFPYSHSKSCPSSPSSSSNASIINPSEPPSNRSYECQKMYCSSQSSPVSVPEYFISSRNLTEMKGNCYSNRIKLNVGGIFYESSLDTILKDPNSYFAAMWRHRNQEEEVFWLDRDGYRFSDVLNFLRNGTVWLNDIPSLMSLKEEAMYFQIQQLQDLCEDKISDINKKKEKEKKEFINQLQDSILTSLSNSSTYPFGKNGGFSKEGMENVFCIDEDF